LLARTRQLHACSGAAAAAAALLDQLARAAPTILLVAADRTPVQLVASSNCVATADQESLLLLPTTAVCMQPNLGLSEQHTHFAVLLMAKRARQLDTVYTRPLHPAAASAHQVELNVI
jgi:hypothetical protein